MRHFDQRGLNKSPLRLGESMATCFCAVEEVSIVPNRLWTYSGYNCTDGKVSDVNVNQPFTMNPNFPSFADGMPSVDDPCSCDDPCCKEIGRPHDGDEGVGHQGRKDQKMGDGGGDLSDLCSKDLCFNPHLDILGQWCAKIELASQHGILHMILFGRRDAGQYRVFGHAYFFLHQCLADTNCCSIDANCLEFTDNHKNVWIGDVEGQQVGPFAMIKVYADAASKRSKHSGAGSAGGAVQA